MRVTDRRTDRILIARPRLHSMQRGKNRKRASRVVVSTSRSRDVPTSRLEKNCQTLGLGHLGLRLVPNSFLVHEHADVAVRSVNVDVVSLYSYYCSSY